MAIIVGGKVVFADATGASSLMLGDLGDVNIDTPVEGNFLTYNGTTLEWNNRSILATDLPDSGVTANTYGSATSIPVITVDDKGRITAVVTQALAAYQPADATLTALAGVTTAANTMQYFTGVDTAASTPLTAFGRSLIDDTDATTARTTLGLGTAATATVTTSYTDITDGRLLKVGDFGLGKSQNWAVIDANTLVQTGTYALDPTSPNTPNVGVNYGSLIVYGVPDLGYCAQTFRTVTGAPGVWTRQKTANVWGAWIRAQQQGEALKGECYLECINAAANGTFSSLTIYTNIPATEGVMWTIKIEGAAEGYTSPVTAVIGGYFYAGAVYLPTMTVLSAGPAATSATAGVVNGKIALRIQGTGYIPRLAVSAIRHPGNSYNPPDSAYQGWTIAWDTAALPSAVAVKLLKAPVLSADASIVNTIYTGTPGAYEHIELKYSTGTLNFGILHGSYWYFKPGADSWYYLGTPSYRWSTIYSSSGTINTSDAREKTAVQPLSAVELTVAKQLASEVGTFQWLTSIAEKGIDARRHVGITAQRVAEIFTSNGLDPFSYGMVCYDQWADEVKNHPEEVIPVYVPAVLDEEGNELEPAYTRHDIIPARDEVTREAGDVYGLRSDQLALFIARGQAQHQSELEARIAAIEAILQN